MAEAEILEDLRDDLRAAWEHCLDLTTLAVAMTLTFVALWLLRWAERRPVSFSASAPS